MAKSLMYLLFTLHIILLSTRQNEASPLKMASENPALDRVLKSLTEDASKHMPALDKFEAIAAMMSDRNAKAVKRKDEEICCYPNQYQRKSITVNGDTYESPYVWVTAEFADAIIGKFLKLWKSPKPWAHLFEKQDNVTLLYNINPVDKTCDTFVILFEVTALDPCYVLPGANYLGGITVGGGNQSIPVQVWEAMDEAEQLLMLTPEVCAPVFSYRAWNFETHLKYSVQYTFNFMASISDPSVFSVPSYCPNVTSATPMAKWPEQLKRYTELHML